MPQDPSLPASPATADQQDVITEPRTSAQSRKGDGCRTDRQRATYPYGRTRVTQLYGRTEREKAILEWLTGHHRNDRHAAIWKLLEAGFSKFFGKTAPPPLTDCGSRRTKSASSKSASSQLADEATGEAGSAPPGKRASPSP